jgi:hypothetical protein
MNSIIQVKYSPGGLYLILKDIYNLTVVYDIFMGAGSILNTSGSEEFERIETENGNIRNNPIHRFEISPIKDSPYIFNSCTDGYVQIWNYVKGYVVNLLQYHAKGDKIKTRFNSKLGILVTGCREMLLWGN